MHMWSYSLKIFMSWNETDFTGLSNHERINVFLRNFVRCTLNIITFYKIFFAAVIKLFNFTLSVQTTLITFNDWKVPQRFCITLEMVEFLHSNKGILIDWQPLPSACSMQFERLSKIIFSGTISSRTTQWKRKKHFKFPSNKLWTSPSWS